MAGFAKHLNEFEEAAISVFAASVDELANAKRIAEETGFPFPVAYGLEAESTAKLLGSFYETAPDGAFLHPADFIVDPGGKIVNATYSTSAAGRLEPEDALRLIDYTKKKAAS